MSLRTRLVLAFAAVVFIPLAVLAFGLRQEMTRLLSDDYEKRVNAVGRDIRKDLDFENARIDDRLASLKNALLNDNQFRAGAVGGLEPAQTYVLDYAGTAMHQTGLSMLQIHDADGSFLMTPMEQGIRVTSGVELTDRDAPSSFAQLDQIVPLARGVVEFGDGVGDTWRGSRPTLPDSLPMIGPAPRHAGLWLAFGNQHIGFTTGPATGAAIAAMIAGAPPPYDVAPFAPGRYIS